MKKKMGNLKNFLITGLTSKQWGWLKRQGKKRGLGGSGIIKEWINRNLDKGE